MGLAQAKREQRDRKDNSHGNFKDIESINSYFQKSATGDAKASLDLLLSHSLRGLLAHFDSLRTLGLGYLAGRLQHRLHPQTVPGTDPGCLHHDWHYRRESRRASLVAPLDTVACWLAVVSVHP